MTPKIPTVRFVLDGQVVQAQDVPASTTLLDYLRERLHRTGTKEGCAEGDCGACVVLIGTLNASANAIDYVPANACLQLLPALHGKALKTVESLQLPGSALHPVQQAMVDCHGSQCGFCTPGIVMSLSGLLATVSHPSRERVQEALSGNLCRCTGYKPIVQAALQASLADPALLSLQDPHELALLQQIHAQGSVTQAQADFAVPASVAELAQILAHDPQATLLAGCSEVGLKVNKQFFRPARLVYLGQVAELRQVYETPAHWRIGAQVSLEQVRDLVQAPYPDFAEVLRRFASPPVRHTATLAGNIANASPIGDSLPCLIALGARLLLRRGEHTRSLLLETFFTGYKKTLLEPGEFIEAIDLPKPQPGQVFRAHKISKRMEQDISAICCALSYRLEQGRLDDVRLAFNGLAITAGRAPKLEAALQGRTPDEVRAADLDAAIDASFTRFEGLPAGWDYRVLVARNLVLDFINPTEVVA